MNGYSELQLGPLDDVHASVVLHPGATLLSLIAGSVGGRPHGVPRQWQHAVASVIDDDAAVLRPLFEPYQSIIPDCLTATATMADADIDTYLDMLADLDAATLTRELAAEFGAEVPTLWRPVMDRPQAWIRAYARLMSRLWREFRTVWHGADALLRRERERVGVAAVTCGLQAVLTGLSNRFRLTGTSIHVPDLQGDRFDLAGRRLTFVPVVSGRGACLFSFDRPDVAWIGYPVPALGRLWSDKSAEVDEKDRVSLIMGRVRATILRSARLPLNVGDLAFLLSCSPATASYHCDRLQEAELVRRERHGRHVRISLTARGEALLDLMGCKS